MTYKVTIENDKIKVTNQVDSEEVAICDMSEKTKENLQNFLNCLQNETKTIIFEVC